MLHRAPGDSRRRRWLWTVGTGASVLGCCLACAPAPAAQAPSSAAQTPALVPTVIAAPPSDAAPSEPTPANAAKDGFPEVERVARALFGKMIGPEFGQYDEATLAPAGYTAQALTYVDFDANQVSDVAVRLERDAETDTKAGPACVLVLGIGIDPTNYRVAGINGHGFACSLPGDEMGLNGSDVTFETSDDGHELVIHVNTDGGVFSQAWSYQVGYDAKTSRFVVSKLVGSVYNRPSMTGETTTLYPLEGRAERVVIPEEGEPESLRQPARRVVFEDLDDEITNELLRF